MLTRTSANTTCPQKPSTFWPSPLTSASHHLKPVSRATLYPEKVGFQLGRQALLERGEGSSQEETLGLWRQQTDLAGRAGNGWAWCPPAPLLCCKTMTLFLAFRVIWARNKGALLGITSENEGPESE